MVAGELAQRGRDVLLLEAGPHLTAKDFTRWEAKATHDFWWPIRFAPLPDGDVVALLGGRCVGGTTTINTKVALRAHERDVAKWHEATGLTNDRGEPFGAADLAPYYDRVEQVLGVRERTDWTTSTRTVDAGFRALGSALEPVQRVHRPDLLAVRVVSPGLPDERRQVDGKHVHRRRARVRLARAARERVRRARADRGRRGDGRRVPGQRGRAARPCAPAPSSSPGER